MITSNVRLTCLAEFSQYGRMLPHASLEVKLDQCVSQTTIANLEISAGS